MEFVARNKCGDEIRTVKGVAVGDVFCVHDALELRREGQFTVSHVKTGFAFPVRFETRQRAVRIARAALRSGMEWDALTLKTSRTPKWRKWWKEFKQQHQL